VSREATRLVAVTPDWFLEAGGTRVGVRSSGRVRPTRFAAFVILAASLAAICGITSALGAGTGPTVSARAGVRLPPSGFAIQPAIADRLCNGGRGIRLAAQLWASGVTAGGAVVATGKMGDGSTLVSLTQVYPGQRFAVLRSVTPRCTLNPMFGHEGEATITISARLPAHPRVGGTPAGGLWVNAVAPRDGGGAILAGTYGGLWVVGEVTRHGQLDPRFGKHGWTVLPFPGEVDAIAQAPSGRIVIGGDNGGSGCCTLNWAAALAAHGQLERDFGNGGRQELPTGEDSAVASLALEPNGDVLAQIGYGNMGCWGEAIAMLTPSGHPVLHFGKTVGRFWQGLNFGGYLGGFGFNAFVGDAEINPDGFTVVGIGQKECDTGQPGIPLSATGLIARFHTNGNPASRAIRFSSRMYGGLQSFSVGDDTVVVESEYAEPTIIRLMMLRPNGLVDRRFGNDGLAQIRTPWQGTAAQSMMLSITRASPSSIAIVAWQQNDNQLQIILVRI